MKLGMVFPGQGSQSVGMLGELCAAREEVRVTFSEANDALGYDLGKMMLEGPEADLNRTQNTQPAVLVAALAVWRVWCALGGPRPQLLAGHSVGEFTALVCADALPFDEAVRFVAERGRTMQDAVPEGEGAVAAVLGLDDDAVAAACEQAANGDVVSPVNFNAPGQVVIAGHRGAVERALEAAKGAGARKAMVLPVSVPVHCALMREPGARLIASIEALNLSMPSIPVIQNVDVSVHSDVEAVRDSLRPHVYSPVPWRRTIEHMGADGVTQLVECGPGRVLTGLTKRIDRSITAQGVYDMATIDGAIEKLSQ